METKKLENLAIDSLWYLLNEQIDFFVRKTDTICNIFNECIELSNVTSYNKDSIKTYFKDYVLLPFKKANLGIQMATRFNNEDASTIFEDGMLNYRGLARIRTCMGIINKVSLFHDDIDNHYFVASILKDFSYKDTKHSKKGMFEIMCEFINARPNLYQSNEKMVANSFIQCTDYSDIIDRLNSTFDRYLANCIKNFTLSKEMRNENNFYRDVPYKIAKEVTIMFDRRDFYATNRIIASDLARNILASYYY